MVRLRSEFADQVRITYVMGGLAREMDDPSDEVPEALDAAAWSGMPVDPRSWLGRGGRPPRSTYPACLAVKAAAEQGLDGPLLRVLREGFWLRGAAQDSPDALEETARGVDGLDLARFAIDLRSNAIAEAFGADLEQARAAPAAVRSKTAEPARAAFPTFVVGADNPRWLSGKVTPQALRDAVAAAGAPPRALPGVGEAVRSLGPLATAEVAAACGLPWARAAADLWARASDLELAVERVLGGELWRPAD